jgi:hypothetical protein
MIRCVPIGVTAPDGTEWTVRVVWQPRWPVLVRRIGGWRRRRSQERREKAWDSVAEGASETADLVPTSGGGGGFLSGLADDEVAFLIAATAIIALASVFWWLLIPLVPLVVDLAVVLVLLALGLGSRVLLRHPWTVEATASSTGRHSVAVVGWRNALRTRNDVAAQMHAGALPISSAGPADPPLVQRLPPAPADD